MTDLTPEQHLWACAVQVVRQHGANAPVCIAGRVTEQEVAGDLAGVETWQRIAVRLDAIAGQPDEAVN